MQGWQRHPTALSLLVILGSPCACDGHTAMDEVAAVVGIDFDAGNESPDAPGRDEPDASVEATSTPDAGSNSTALPHSEPSSDLEPDASVEAASTPDAGSSSTAVPHSEPSSDPEPSTTSPTVQAPSPDVPDSGPSRTECPAVAERPIVDIGGDITTDTEWTCDNTYRLTTFAHVRSEAELRVQAGTHVLADFGATLVIVRGSRLFVEGTAEAPVVFTSSAASGARAAGDWGGIVLLGAAPISNPNGEDIMEGFGPRAVYGGSDAAWSCGALRFVRIEFAGGLVALDVPLMGLALAGCGSETTIQYVQVHRSADHGVALFGGSARLEHVVITEATRYGFMWREGWQGHGQFLVVHQRDVTLLLNGIEGRNHYDDFDAAPRSMPTIHNFTLAGPMDYGILLRGGTWGALRNGIVTTAGVGIGVDVRDSETAAGMEQTPLTLTVENTIFYENIEDFSTDATDNDDNFDEAAFLGDPARGNLVMTNPEFESSAEADGLEITPSAGSLARDVGVPPPLGYGFDETATYVGAIDPEGEDWTVGWTSFVDN